MLSTLIDEEEKILLQGRPNDCVVRKVYEHLKEERAREGNRCYLPKRRLPKESADEKQKNSPKYKSLEKVREKMDRAKITPADMQLLALLPGPLHAIFGEEKGRKHFGCVQQCEGGWCWVFDAPGVHQRSQVFTNEKDANEDLRWIHISLYPVWLKEEDRAEHLQYLMRRREEDRALEEVADTATLKFAEKHLAPTASSSSQRADLRQQQ